MASVSRAGALLFHSETSPGIYRFSYTIIAGDIVSFSPVPARFLKFFSIAKSLVNAGNTSASLLSSLCNGFSVGDALKIVPERLSKGTIVSRYEFLDTSYLAQAIGGAEYYTIPHNLRLHKVYWIPHYLPGIAGDLLTLTATATLAFDCFYWIDGNERPAIDDTQLYHPPVLSIMNGSIYIPNAAVAEHTLTVAEKAWFSGAFSYMTFFSVFFSWGALWAGLSLSSYHIMVNEHQQQDANGWFGYPDRSPYYNMTCVIPNIPNDCGLSLVSLPAQNGWRIDYTYNTFDIPAIYYPTSDGSFLGASVGGLLPHAALPLMSIILGGGAEGVGSVLSHADASGRVIAADDDLAIYKDDTTEEVLPC